MKRNKRKKAKKNKERRMWKRGWRWEPWGAGGSGKMTSDGTHAYMRRNVAHPRTRTDYRG